MTDSLADLVDYDAQFKALAARGILFSEEDKKKFRDICTEELTQNDTIDAPNLLYEFLAFLQNIFNGIDLQHLGDSFSATLDRTGNQEKLYRLQQAALHIHDRFVHEGGSFTNAAELVSGQHVPVNSQDHAQPPDMEDSLFRQVYAKAIQLPWGTTSSLNNPNGPYPPENITPSPTPPMNPGLTREPGVR